MAISPKKAYYNQHTSSIFLNTAPILYVIAKMENDGKRKDTIKLKPEITTMKQRKSIQLPAKTEAEEPPTLTDNTAMVFARPTNVFLQF